MSSIRDHWEHMSQFLTENRVARFEEVLNERTYSAIPILEDTAKEQNASAVLRTMDALGFHEVHMVESNWKVKLNNDISKGSDKWLDLRKSSDMTETLKGLKSRGYRIAVTTPHENGLTIRQLPLDKPIAVVFGNEWDGISEDAKNLADCFLQIPMYGFVESYNLSVSVGMTFGYLRWELEKRNLLNILSETERLEWKLRWAVHSARSGPHLYKKWLEEQGETDQLGILKR